MSNQAATGLDVYYSELQGSFQVDYTPAFASLVVASQNAEVPIHRWFHFKEGFSHQLLDSVLEFTSLAGRPVSVVDPFCGSGTTIISALTTSLARVTGATGFETNPFVSFVAKTKLEGLRMGKVDLTSQKRQFVRSYYQANFPDKGLPALSTFRNQDYFPRETLDALLRIRCAASEAFIEPVERNLALLALASIIEPSSRLRKDGRALRFEPTKILRDPLAHYLERLEIIEEDLAGHKSENGEIRLGNGLELAETLEEGGTDLMLFSPPYPNNIDYTEVYKLEAWFLGFYESAVDFRAQRFRTLRSHPSCRFADRYFEFLPSALSKSTFENLLRPLLDAIPGDSDHGWRGRLVKGYFSDMCEILWKLKQALKPGGQLVFVVANSRHGSKKQAFTIAADLLMAAMAVELGFRFRGIKVARFPKRRQCDPFLRESIIWLEKVS
jgi:SAM-dependent methyltransferase